MTRPAFQDDGVLVSALRAGDETAFAHVLDRHSAALLSVATVYVGSRQVAEEVVQETWLAVLRGIDGFERRSSFKTWLFRILLNKARTRGSRERRSVPVGVPRPGEDPPGSAQWWASHPAPWEDLPEQRLVGKETLERIRAAIDALPPTQRSVVTLRDVHGCTAGEVCARLGLTDANQRVLLHRGRVGIRRALKGYLPERA